VVGTTPAAGTARRTRADDGCNIVTTSRDKVLGDIRKALGKRAQRDEAATAALTARLEAHEPGTIPKRAQTSAAEQRRLFVKMAQEAAATVEELKTLDDVPKAVAEFLAAHNIASEIVTAPDPALQDIDWKSRETLEVRTGAAEPNDQTSVTTAFAGVAETGTLVLTSGPDTPTTLNFMPDNHIVVLRAEQIVGDYEAVWAKLREKANPDGTKVMPRAVNWITGPSRSADIEQKLLMGAHGPRRLHILIVDK
jgi:L-lactate dehydrogenase complex protein LldG